MTGDAALTIVPATTSRGKLAELRALLADLPVELVSLASVAPTAPPVVEDGATFEANALLKARAAAARTMLISVADDSGLEIDALSGRPGVRSARFAGEGATDAENNAAVLDALQEVEDEARTARFRCVLVVVDPLAADDAPPLVVEGVCEGAIARQASGVGGFGYDPLFVVRGAVSGAAEKTMSELSDAEKNEVSHRGRAVRALRPLLEALVRERLESAARIEASFAEACSQPVCDPMGRTSNP
jgi:XTP/dITP diphosphohydrolase